MNKIFTHKALGYPEEYGTYTTGSGELVTIGQREFEEWRAKQFAGRIVATKMTNIDANGPTQFVAFEWQL